MPRIFDGGKQNWFLKNFKNRREKKQLPRGEQKMLSFPFTSTARQQKRYYNIKQFQRKTFQAQQPASLK